ncbi:unnamed protein product [Somion occarium]|uniref:F-box domain-containing protein n=1 Tax=Somion occarium TaxID=3059160 RepID=A0ABP1CK50_9APHY
MSSWKTSFQRGVSSFRGGQLQDALQHFSQAVQQGCNDPNVYDSRAAVHEKLGNTKEALLDSKKVIDLSPQRWQGYFRAARLFLNLRKFDRAKAMAAMALERVKPDDSKRLAELKALQEKIESALQAFVEHQTRQASKHFYHFGKLPVEIAMMIFSITLQDVPAKVVYLAQVCKDWRDTILNMPSLWRNLILTNRNPMRKAKVWKSRCEGRLARLHLQGSAVHLALDILQDIDWDHLRGLTLEDVDLDVIREKLLSPNPTIFRDLESLSVEGATRSPTNIDWLWQHSEMRLQNLTVRSHRISWPTMSINTSCLRSLLFDGPIYLGDDISLLFLLQSNPCLESVDLTTWIPTLFLPDEDEVPDVPSSVEMPRLNTISIRGDGFPVAAFCSKLIMPNLQKLSLSRCREPLDLVFRVFSSSRVVQSLTELRIQRCVVALQNIIDILKLATNLELLELIAIGGANMRMVAEALAEPQGEREQKEGKDTQGGLLCPSLKHLNLSEAPDLQAGPLVRLIKARNTDADGESESERQVARIHTLILDACPLLDGDILPWIRSKVPHVSCVYMSKKEASWKR